MKGTNLKIFGISKQKNLADFVTTQKDVEKGNTRIPLNLARLREEDLMSDEELQKARIEMEKEGMVDPE